MRIVIVMAAIVIMAAAMAHSQGRAQKPAASKPAAAKPAAPAPAVSAEPAPSESVAPADAATVGEPSADGGGEESGGGRLAEAEDDGEADALPEPAAPKALPAPVRIGGPNRLDGIAAVVGDEIILVSEVEAYVNMRLAALGISPQDADIKKTVELCLNDLIDNKALVVRAKGDSTINVRNDEVESTLNNHINMILRQNNITAEQLEMQLRAQQGTTLSRFKTEARRAIREQLLKQKLQQSYFFGTRVNRRDVEKFYAEYADSLPVVGESFELLKLSLRVAPSDSVRQAAFDRIRSVKKLLDEGGNFGELAKKYSESPEGASGGELGYLEKGSTTEIVLEERAFGLPVGRVSEPFETRLGFHILLVEEKRDRRVKLRQILVRNAATESERAAIVARLDSLRGAVKSREEFEAAARFMSVDNVTRTRGGDMGWVGLMEMSSVLREAVQGLESGQISAPVAEGSVVSIYMAVNRADSRKLTLENDYAVIAEKTKDIMAQKRLIETVRAWREKIYIDIRI